MGIRVSFPNKEAKASIKLFNAIASYRFEQKYGEMKGHKKLDEALDTAQKYLTEIINNSRNG